LLPNKIKLKISAKNFPSGCAATNGSKTKDSEISIQRGDIENFNQFGLDGPGDMPKILTIFAFINDTLNIFEL